MTLISDYVTKLIITHLLISDICAVTTPVQIEGVAPTCSDSGEQRIGNEVDLRGCSCEKWHLLWSPDKAGNNQCEHHCDVWTGTVILLYIM